MTYNDIAQGMYLRLKRERRDAYELRCSCVLVLGKKDRAGYKVGFIHGEYSHYGETLTGYFKPSDFSGQL